MNLSATSSKLKGKVTRIFFHEPSSDFYIISLKVGDDSKKAKGYFTSVKLAVGLELEMEGTWEFSKKYGQTFVAQKSEEVLSTTDSIERYLIDNVKSIGPITASRIVDVFGKDTLDIFDSHPEKIESLPFLNKNQAQALLKEWNESNLYRSTAIALMNCGVPTSAVKRIYSKFGDSTLDLVYKNPYILSSVKGIGFMKSDSIALKLGTKPDSSYRISAILEYSLTKAAAGSGHLFLPTPSMKNVVNSLLESEGLIPVGREITDKDISDALKSLSLERRVHVDGERTYLERNYYYETQCAKRIASLSDTHDLGIDVEAFITDYEEKHDVEFSDEQKDALFALNTNKVLLVVGHPGTGKTFLVHALTALLRQANLKFELMSPTGIAAKKLSSVVKAPASTIHRVLGYKGVKGREDTDSDWNYHEGNQFPIDAVICDEASMIDQELFYRLLSALDNKTLLIMVGDHAQLPSVGAGNVLHDLMRSKIKKVALTRIFRQESASDIIINAHRINRGETPIVGDPRSPSVDFRFIQQKKSDEITRGILTLVEKLHHSPAEASFQVLTPRYKSDLGVNSLNDQIKELLNPNDSNKREISLGAKSFREDDRIIVTENNYKMNVFNGEVGKIIRIDRESKTMNVRVFDEPHDKEILMEFSEAREMLQHAYALTIHKSQGNQWDYVILPFVSAFSLQLQRNLLYTAVTRAKKKVFIIGEWKAVVRAIENNEVINRNTYLAKRLTDMLEQQG